MELNDLNMKWQETKIPSELDQSILEKMNSFESSLKKENLKLSIWLAGTIYLTGLFVFPFLETSSSMILMAGIWLLIGILAIVFWMRQSTVKRNIINKPQQYIDAKLSKLKYNLMVTNVFMPLYIILLGTLSSLYISNVLEGVDNVIVYAAIAFNCIFYILVFLVFWKKQRKRDSESVIPQIEELKRIKAGYNNV